MPQYYREQVFIDENYAKVSLVVPFKPTKLIIRQVRFLDTSGGADSKTYYLKWDVDPYVLCLLSFQNTNTYQKTVKDIDRAIPNLIKFQVYKSEDNSLLTNAFDLSLLLEFESD